MFLIRNTRGLGNEAEREYRPVWAAEGSADQAHCSGLASGLQGATYVSQSSDLGVRVLQQYKGCLF